MATYVPIKLGSGTVIHAGKNAYGRLWPLCGRGNTHNVNRRPAARQVDAELGVTCLLCSNRMLRSTPDGELTQMQVNAISNLRGMFGPKEGYEFKRNEVENRPWDDGSGGWSTFLWITTGLIGDEGTPAETLGRTRRLFMVNKRGEIRTCDGSRWQMGITHDTMPN